MKCSLTPPPLHHASLIVLDWISWLFLKYKDHLPCVVWAWGMKSKPCEKLLLVLLKGFLLLFLHLPFISANCKGWTSPAKFTLMIKASHIFSFFTHIPPGTLPSEKKMLLCIWIYPQWSVDPTSFKIWYGFGILKLHFSYEISPMYPFPLVKGYNSVEEESALYSKIPIVWHAVV